MPKKTTKKIKSYICPNCKKMQISAIEWQTMSIAYEFNLTTGDSKDFDREGGDLESWACPSCGKDLPSEMYSKIQKMLGW